MKTRLRELVVAAVLLLGTTAGASAQDGPVVLAVGTAFRLFVKQAFATVIVGDPLVLDVRTDDSQSIVIEPLRAGETNLVFVDARGVVIANVRISICGTPPAKGCVAGQIS